MSENRVEPVRHFLVRNHVNFARDVEVSTIARNKGWRKV